MKLYAGGYLTFYMPDQDSQLEYEISDPVELITLLDQLGIPVGEVQLVILNGQIVDLTGVILENQDEVKVYPGLGGG